MSQFSFKIAVCIASFASSGLLAVDPAQLGRDIVMHTMYGIVDVVRNDQFQADICQKNVACCVASARKMNQDWQKKHFLQTGIDTLKNMNIRRLGEGFSTEQLLRIALSKYVGIEIFARALSRGADSGFLSGWTDTLFSGMPFYCQGEESQAFARAAIKACREVGLACDECEDEIAENIMDTVNYGYDYCSGCGFSTATEIALDLIMGAFGDRVAPFLIGAKMFVAA